MRQEPCSLARSLRRGGPGAVGLAFASLGLLLAFPAEAVPPYVAGVCVGERGEAVAASLAILERLASSCATETPAGRAATVASAVGKASGDFEIPIDRPGMWVLCLSAPGRLSLERDFTPLAYGLNVGPVALPPAIETRVRVVDREGKPLPDLELVIHRKALAADWWLSERRATTDGSGWAVLPLFREEGVGMEAQGFEVLALDQAVNGEFLLTLAPSPEAPASERRRPPIGAGAAAPRRLEGRVVQEADGAPVAGAVVWVSTDPSCYALSSPDGSFVLLAPPADAPEVSAAKPGFLEIAEPVPTTGGATDLVLTLAPAPAAVEGRVVDSRGRAMEGARVESKRPPRWTVSDRTGRFRLEGFALPGWADLAVAKAGFAPSRKSLAMGSSGAGPPPLEIVLFRLRRAVGGVTDESGRPLASVAVSVVSGHDAPPPTVTGEDGRFELSGLYEGYYQAAFELPGYGTALRRFEVGAAEAPLEITAVRLSRELRIAGTVLDEEGAPLAGTEVYIRRGDGHRKADDNGKPSWPAETETGADGSFEVRALEPGSRVQLEVWRSGYLPGIREVLVADGTPVLEFRLQPSVRVLGRVEDREGTPVPHAEVTLYPEYSREKARPVEGSRLHSGSTDSEGRFVLEHVRPGRTRFEVLSGGSAVLRRRVEIPKTRETFEVTLTLAPEAILQAIVRDQEGGAIAGARVEVPRLEVAAPDIWGFFTADSTDSAGQVRLQLLTPGPARVEVSHPLYQGVVREMLLQAGEQSAEFVLRARDLFNVSGSLREEAGMPLAGVRLELHNSTSGRSQQASTDDAGRFLFEGVVSGTYTTRLHASGLALLPSTPAWRVEGDDLEGLNLVASKVCLVHGEVTGLTPTEMAELSIVASSGTVARHGSVDPRTASFDIGEITVGRWTLSAALAGSGRIAQAEVACEGAEGPLAIALDFGPGDG